MLVSSPADCTQYQHYPYRSYPLLSSYYRAPGTGFGLMHQMSSNSHNNSISWYYNCVCSIDVEGKLRKVKQHAQDHTTRKVKSWDLNLAQFDYKVCSCPLVSVHFAVHSCCPLSSFIPFCFPSPCRIRRYHRSKQQLSSDKASSSQYNSDKNIITENLGTHHVSLDSLHLAHTVAISLYPSLFLIQILQGNQLSSQIILTNSQSKLVFCYCCTISKGLSNSVSTESP